MREKRDEIIILRTTKAEKNRIYEKMLGMGIRSLSAYIRKMALDGYCLHLDLKELRRMAYAQFTGMDIFAKAVDDFRTFNRKLNHNIGHTGKMFLNLSTVNLKSCFFNEINDSGVQRSVLTIFGQIISCENKLIPIEFM